MFVDRALTIQLTRTIDGWRWSLLNQCSDVESGREMCGDEALFQARKCLDRLLFTEASELGHGVVAKQQTDQTNDSG